MLRLVAATLVVLILEGHAFDTDGAPTEGTTQGSCMIQNTRSTDRVQIMEDAARSKRRPAGAAEPHAQDDSDASLKSSNATALISQGAGTNGAVALANNISASKLQLQTEPVRANASSVHRNGPIIEATSRDRALLALSLCTELLQQIWFWLASIFLMALFIATTCLEVIHPTARNRQLTKAELQAPCATAPAPARISTDMIAQATHNSAG
mmetsp:Transcript_38122/g.89349  ORF Transcript_38122/g.89349 Transcript_38122/m.89349 type:complete len:211 (-) Transcript_38122:133-765(-)